MPDAGKPKSFEQALAELEEIVRALEAGELTLEESLARYKSGVGLLQSCYSQLREAEQQILQLAGEDTEGKPVSQPFEHMSADVTPAERRRARRSEA